MASPQTSRLVNLTEDSFEIRCNVTFFEILPDTEERQEIRSIQIFESPLSMSCEELLRDVPRFLRTAFSNGLPEEIILPLTSHSTHITQTTLELIHTPETTTHHRRRLTPLTMNVGLIYTNDVQAQEFDGQAMIEEVYEDNSIDLATEQSMQQLLMVPALKDSFEIRCNLILWEVVLNTGEDREVRNIHLFESPLIMSCEELLQDVPTFVRITLSNHLPEDYYLPEEHVHSMISYITSEAQGALLEYADTTPHHHRLIPLNLYINGLYSSHDEGQEMTEVDDGDNIDLAIDQSLQQLFMVPASKEAIASLKMFKVFDDEIKVGERCNICLENVNHGEDLLAMPCEHIFHYNCLVEWLQISHICPLCRSHIPVVE
ncbi:hypothetical protein K1719_028390 [Acacia pycnantha]|nr:hypothetical protein K1719_028390 [Acacia pycnantha]